MKKRFFIFALLLAALCLMAAAASAAVTISGYDPVDMQIGLPTEWPSSGGFYSRGVEFHYAVDGNPTDIMNSTIVWSVTPTNGGPALTITSEGTGRESTRAWLNLDPTVSYTPGKNYTYDLSMNINGSITTRSITVNFVDNQVPTGYGLTVAPVTFTSSSAALGTPVAVTDGKMYNTTGETYVVSIEIFGTSLDYSSSWRIWSDTEWKELEIWDDSRLEDLNLDGGKTGIYTAKQVGTYPDHFYVVSFYGMNSSNIACYIPYTLYVTEAEGQQVPELKLSGYKTDVNIYLGLEQYGSGIGQDSIGVWGDELWITSSFRNYKALQDYYGGKPTWTVRRYDGVVSTSAGYSDLDSDEGVLELLVRIRETQPCDVEYQVTCQWGDQSDSFTTTAHYIQLPTVPTGLDFTKEYNNLKAGDTLRINPTVLPANANIPGYDYRVYLFDEQMNEFAELDADASTSAEKVYKVIKPGVYAATILLQADTVTIGQETIFRIADANGNVPKPEIQVGSWEGFEKKFYIGAGLTSVEPGLGKLFSDDFVDSLYFENESVLNAELKGDPVWTIQENGTTPAHAGIRGSGKEQAIYLKALPTAAGDKVYDISCTWDGQSWTGTYTIHFVNCTMPSGVTFTPENHVVVAKPWDVVNYEIHFKGWTTPEDVWEWKELSEDLQEAMRGSFAPSTPGTYEGYMQFNSGNLHWREKLTLIVTENNGTMQASDYRNVGTVQQLPRDLKVIEDEAFAGTQMTEVDIPAGVTSIGQDAFDGCGLIGIYTHNNQAAIDYAVQNGFVAIVE